MSIIDFLLQILAFVIGSVLSTLIITVIGFFTIKHLFNKGMQSKEVQDLKDGFDRLKKELEKLSKTIMGENQKSYVS